MSDTTPRPPLLASVLLRLLLPKGIVRDSILGDFWEEYGQRVAAGSGLNARLWYWRQALGLGGRSLARRMSLRRLTGDAASPSAAAGDTPDTSRPLAFGAGSNGSPPRGNVLDDLAIDLRYGIRQLFRRPAFTAMIVLTLAVGIGPNVAIFSVMKGLVLRSLPYPEPHRVVAIWQTETSWRGYMPLSTHAYDALRENNSTFEELGVYEPYHFNLRDEGEPIRVGGVACTASVLRALGMEPARGRLFTDDEELAGRNRVVLLSDGFWKRRYAADPNIVGKLVNINGSDFRIIGVMPESFELVSPWGGSARPDIHLPLVLARGDYYQARHWLLSLGRLKPGVTARAAEADIRGIAARLAEEAPATNALIQVWIDPLLRSSLGGVTRMLVFLLLIVGVVLLIACANVASMLLARGTHRMTELAVRATMGAGRRRLIRQLLTESLLLSVLGGAVAVLIAVWGVEALRELIPGRIPRVEGVQVDGWVLVFTLVVTSITGIIFGLAPALFASRADLAGALKEGLGIDGGWRSRRRSLRILLALQIAMAFALVNAATLLVVSYQNVVSIPLGFDGSRVLLASIYTDGAAYATGEARVAFWKDLTDRVESLPGVEIAAATTKLPLRGGNNGFVIAAEDAYDPNTRGVLVEYSWVMSGYIEAMGIPVLEGRTLEQGDLDAVTNDPGADLRVVVNRAFVDRFWPGESGIGRRLRQNGNPATFTATVVGVVENVRQMGLERPTGPEIYFPYTPITRRPTFLVARTAADPNALIPAVRQVVSEIDSNLAITATSMGEIVEAVTESRRFSTLLVTLFAGTALFLVLAGTYGIMSYSVSQRVREVGVRVALGAGRGRLVLFFLGNGLRFAAWGIGFGFVATIWVGLITWNRVYGVNPFNPALILGGALLMVLVILAAIAVPVYRASRVDPMQALRSE